MSDYSEQRRYKRDVETAVFQYAAAFVFLWLLAGFWQLQVRNPEIYEERAARNRVRALPVLAPRGKLLDRDGRVLVDNWPAFKVMLTRDEINLNSLPLIADGLNLPYDRLQQRIREMLDSTSPEYEQVILKESLTPTEVAFLEAHKAELRELELLRSPKRLYPRDGVAAHVIGYVGEISEAELDEEEFALYESGAEIGKAGVEREYNDMLTGADGSRLVLVDSRSRRIRDLDLVEAKPGRAVKVTLDLDLQAAAELGMEGRRGAVVALNPRNGEVLAMVSSPRFDPNKFVGGISPEDWTALMDHPDNPLLNRAIQAQLAPGSIFKPIVGWAALDSGAVDTSFQAYCGGGASFFGRFFRCHRAGGHGWVDMELALEKSCDVFFYTLGKELGIDKIAEYSQLAGLGAKTGIDLPHEEEGIVPSSKWKVRRYRDRWWPGETISVAIGQGALTLTPIQAAYAVGGLAMGGVWHTPHLLPYEQMSELREGFEPPEPRRARVNPRHLDLLLRGLWGVVNDGGTGARAMIPGVEVCGKTGTAQRVSRALAQNSDDPRLLDDGWFVGFAPCREPEIVVSVLFENGEHGSWASPIARDVIKAHFDKKTRLDWNRRRNKQPAEQPSPTLPPSLAAAEETLQ